jgi:predicted alpha/beta hydrolase family esterase
VEYLVSHSCGCTRAHAAQVLEETTKLQLQGVLTRVFCQPVGGVNESWTRPQRM